MNPFGGCLPSLVQMPVWWALYTALQTAVELYHTPFLWFHDLSAPDPYFILPLVLGALSFVQQKLMPQQDGHRAAEDDDVLDAGALHRHDAFPARRASASTC